MKVSENESIRKTLIDFVEQYGDNYYGQVAKASAISWLEKQGEQKSADKVKPKFKVGDKVQCSWSDEIFTIKMVDDYGYRLNNNMFVDFPDEKSLSLVVEKPELKVCVDLKETPYLNSIWKDTLTNLITDITNRNVASFSLIIDETLKYMDCGAYDEMACKGMRLFAKELKKRIGYE